MLNSVSFFCYEVYAVIVFCPSRCWTPDFFTHTKLSHLVNKKAISSPLGGLKCPLESAVCLCVCVVSATCIWSEGNSPRRFTVSCWCWCTDLYQVQGQQHLSGGFKALYTSACWLPGDNDARIWLLATLLKVPIPGLRILVSLCNLALNLRKNLWRQ